MTPAPIERIRQLRAEGWTLRAIGAELGITRQAVSARLLREPRRKPRKPPAPRKPPKPPKPPKLPKPPKPKRPRKRVPTELIARYETGQTTATGIARTLGLSLPTVCARLREAGARRRLPPDLAAEYERGETSTRALARATGWHRDTVRAHLRQAGVPVRRCGRGGDTQSALSRQIDRSVYRQIRSGASLSRVARSLGVTPVAVRRRYQRECLRRGESPALRRREQSEESRQRDAEIYEAYQRGDTTWAQIAEQHGVSVAAARQRYWRDTLRRQAAR